MKTKNFPIIVAFTMLLWGDANAENSETTININGKWCNQLGSYMKIHVNGNNIDGKYYSAVGNADNYYVVRGRRVVNDDGSQNLGFAVSWENDVHGNSHSVTTWAGQAQIIDEQPTITTQWLLVRKTPPSKNWESTWTNKDIFTRCRN